MNYKVLPYMLVVILYSFNVVTKSAVKVKNQKTENLEKKTVEINLAQPLTRQEVDLVTFFSKPIDFTPEGLEYYFKYVYNHPEYPQHLPYNFSHMIQFLKYGIQSGQNEQFAASVIKMFMQKIKEAPFVEAENFAEFLQKFSQAIKPYLEKKQANFLTEMQIVLKEKLSKIFAQYFSYFQNNPDGFMNTLAEQIAKQTNQSVTQQHIDVEHIKKDVVRFLEIAANKLVWSSQDDIQIWYNCNRLADECQICLDLQILCDENDLNDMCWSLIHRFCYFVQLSHETLSQDFFSQVLHDLKVKNPAMARLGELEELMTKKRDFMTAKIEECRNLCLNAVQVQTDQQQPIPRP